MNKQYLIKPYMSGFPISLCENSNLMQWKPLIKLRNIMKRRKTDNQTIDMFYIPPPPVTSDGGLACRVEIARIMSLSMKGQDREEIASRISRMTGRTLSKHRLNQMTAESAEEHTNQALAFQKICKEARLAYLFTKFQT